MKADKNTIPIYIGVALSLITFFAVWAFGAIALLVIQHVLQTVLGLFVFTVLLLLAVPRLKGRISLSAVTNAYILYLGALFISMSRFKSEIAEGNIDISMVGVGLALIAIALGLTSQRREEVVGESSIEETTEPPPTEGKKQPEEDQ